MLLQQENRYRSSSRSWIVISLSEFIWDADKETLTLIIFEPRLVLAFLSILSWLSGLQSPDNISLRPHCNSRFLFIKDLKCYAISSVLTWKKENQMSLNATSRRYNSAVCHVLCFVRWGKRIEKILIARWSELLNCGSAFSKHARAYSAHPLNPHPRRLK